MEDQLNIPLYLLVMTATRLGYSNPRTTSDLGTKDTETRSISQAQPQDQTELCSTGQIINPERYRWSHSSNQCVRTVACWNEGSDYDIVVANQANPNPCLLLFASLRSPPARGCPGFRKYIDKAELRNNIKSQSLPALQSSIAAPCSSFLSPPFEYSATAV